MTLPPGAGPVCDVIAFCTVFASRMLLWQCVFNRRHISIFCSSEFGNILLHLLPLGRPGDLDAVPRPRGFEPQDVRLLPRCVERRRIGYRSRERVLAKHTTRHRAAELEHYALEVLKLAAA